MKPGCDIELEGVVVVFRDRERKSRVALQEQVAHAV